MSYEPPVLPPTNAGGLPLVPPAPPYPPVFTGGYPHPGQPFVVVANQAPTSGFAVAALVLGIVGILGGWCTLAIPCVLAVIFGHAALNETKNNVKQGRGMAIAGLVLGYVCLAPAALLFF